MGFKQIKRKMSVETLKARKKERDELYRQDNPKYDASVKIGNLKKRIKTIKKRELKNKAAYRKELQEKVIIAGDGEKERYEREIEDLDVDAFTKDDVNLVTSTALQQLSLHMKSAHRRFVAESVIFWAIYFELRELIKANHYQTDDEKALAFFNFIFDANDRVPQVFRAPCLMAELKDTTQSKRRVEDFKAMLYYYVDHDMDDDSE